MLKKKKLKLVAESGASLNLRPPLGARGGDGVKEALRIVLLLDLLKPRVIGAPEGLLPVGLERVGLQQFRVSSLSD